MEARSDSTNPKSRASGSKASRRASKSAQSGMYAKVSKSTAGSFLRQRPLAGGEGDVLEATLREAGIEASPRAFMVMVVDAAESFRTVPAPDPGTQLSDGDVAALKRGGFALGPPREDEPEPISQTVAKYVAMLDGAFSVAEAAKRLRVDQSRVRQLLSTGALYGVKLHGEWRLPAFQFTNRGVVPGIQQVLRELPDDLHPVEVLEWFRNPDPDLEIGENSVSPLDWLRSGGEPERVSAVARDL